VLSYSFFTFLGPVIASHAFEHSGSVVAIGTLGLFALLTIIGIRVLPHNFRRVELVANANSSSRRTTDLLAIQDLRLWIVISSIFTANQTLYPFILSLHVAHIGLAVSQAGWMLGAFALGTLTSRLFTPLLVRYIRPDVTLIAALISAAGVYAFIPVAHETTTLIALSAALGLPLGVGTPVALAMIYEASPQGRVNEALGISMSVNNFLQTVFPLLIGVVASGLGVAPMVWTWSCVILLSALLTLLRSRRLQQDDC
jgi:predicted MFS family arabinose efflux permease